MNSDFKELLLLLHEENVEYLVVGGYAVIFHSQPRYTKDLDLWFRPSSENAAKLMKVFRRFGIPLLNLNESDFAVDGTQLSLGVEPNQIDLLTTIPGLNFEQAWETRVTTEEESFPIHYLSKNALLTAKKLQAGCKILPTLKKLSEAEG